MKLTLGVLLIGEELPRGIWERFRGRVGKERCLSLPSWFCVESDCLTMIWRLVSEYIPLALVVAVPVHLAECFPEREGPAFCGLACIFIYFGCSLERVTAWTEFGRR